MIVTPLTTSRRGLDLHIELPANRQTGLWETSYLQSELLHCLNAARLSHRLGIIDPQTSRRVREIVRTLLNHP